MEGETQCEPSKYGFCPGEKVNVGKSFSLGNDVRLLATDVCVPISSLPEVVLAAKEDILRCVIAKLFHKV